MVVGAQEATFTAISIISDRCSTYLIAEEIFSDCAAVVPGTDNKSLVRCSKFLRFRIFDQHGKVYRLIEEGRMHGKIFFYDQHEPFRHFMRMVDPRPAEYWLIIIHAIPIARAL